MCLIYRHSVARCQFVAYVMTNTKRMRVTNSCIFFSFAFCVSFVLTLAARAEETNPSKLVNRESQHTENNANIKLPKQSKQTKEIRYEPALFTFVCVRKYSGAKPSFPLPPFKSLCTFAQINKTCYFDSYSGQSINIYGHF